MGPQAKSLSERFWPKVQQQADGCWLWQGNTNGAGYGMIFDGDTKVLAHRASWELHHGPVPQGLRVLHVCDTPLCVRPDHLVVGSQSANMRDMAQKRRNRNQHVAITTALSDAQVQAVRERYAAGTSQTILAKEYGISQASVSRLVLGKDRVAAGGPMGHQDRKALERKLTDDQVREMRASRVAGAQQQALADQYGVSKALVQQIVTHRAWKHVA